MGRRDEGHYSEKHPPGTAVRETLAAAVRKRAISGEMGCADAFDIAATLGVPPREIGAALDLMEIRIAKCQLGLFGYGSGVKILKKADTVAPELEKAIRDKLDHGRLSCAATWEIGAQLDVPRMGVSSACEMLGIKIKPCQLGAF
ncbi:MAG: hypothetical protein HY742_08490 [Deltaproteobacteria bacterium]|nr:hypothetical protein [Deltaproteobacteria bacterium]